MSDKSKLEMLGRLELMKGQDGERRPYSARAQAEIDEAHASQARIDEMAEGEPEDATPEDAEEAPPEANPLVEALNEALILSNAEVERYRQANVALNSKLVATGGELTRLKRVLARIKLEHPEYFGENKDQDADSE